MSNTARKQLDPGDFVTKTPDGATENQITCAEDTPAFTLLSGEDDLSFFLAYNQSQTRYARLLNSGGSIGFSAQQFWISSEDTPGDADYTIFRRSLGGSSYYLTFPNALPGSTQVLTVADDGTVAWSTFSAPGHLHSAADITSGTLAVARGGTGVTTSTGSGNTVLSTSPTLTTPTLGVASATSVNKVAITEPATAATLTLANNSTLATSGANSITLTSTGATNVTLPTSGTLVNSDVTTLSSLASVGTITTGVWSGTAIGTSKGGTGLTSITNNSVLAVNGSGTVSYSTSPTVVGTVTANAFYGAIFNFNTQNCLLYCAAAVSPDSGNAVIASDTSSVNCKQIRASSFCVRATPTGSTLAMLRPSGDISCDTAGSGLMIKEGSNAKMGVATLSAGTVTVSTTKVTANSRIFLTIQSLGTVSTPKAIAVTARTAATSFTITSADNTDTSVVAWQIVEPA